MAEEDSSSADAQEATTDGMNRRRVLGGVGAAIGAVVGLSGAAAARQAEPAEVGGGGAAATCEPGCNPQYFCARYEDGRCAEWWWYCDCEST